MAAYGIKGVVIEDTGFSETPIGVKGVPLSDADLGTQFSRKGITTTFPNNIPAP